MCRRCGHRTYHAQKKICASCGYGKSAKLRGYSWKRKTNAGLKKHGKK
jgi:large subunit ribosomal protein L37e